MTDLLVVGGGAAGLAAAIAAAECGDRVTVLERMDRVGKKLLATGNGRCNLMNTGDPRYPGGGDFAARVLAQMGPERQRRFWEAHGLRLRQEEDGRVYPACGQASAVLDTLRLALDAARVRVETGTPVDALRQEERGWTVLSGDRSFSAGRVLICGGGRAQEKLGSDGSALRLLREMKVPVTPFAPALTQIETDPEPIRGLSGLRARGTVEIEKNGKILHAEQGEILFADYGISGVCTMQCARWAEPGSVAVLRLCGGMGFSGPEALLAELKRRRVLWPRAEAAALWTGLCGARLGLAILKAAGIRAKDRDIASLTDRELRAAAASADRFALPVRGIRGFEASQVCRGGADPAAFDPRTLQCRALPGLYAAGEVLDVDGDCGGFNLMFAFGSGLLAGLDGRKAAWEEGT